MRILGRLCVAVAAAGLAVGAVAQKASMRIVAVDVEGGQATLFVAPTGQSLLVDTGWGGNNGRDADRIVAAAKSLGVTRIDTVLITHYHDDHAGGIPQLAARIPIGGFLDHGDRIATDPNDASFYSDYRRMLATGKYRHAVMKAGEKLPTPGFDAVAISSAGAVTNIGIGLMDRSLNRFCVADSHPAEDTSENGQSLGILIRFAGLKILDAGDLTADRERMLVCPANKLGRVDLLIVSHHGVDWSSSPVFINSIAPRVAVMDNGAHKGASTSVIDTIRKSPRIEALYQLHLAPPAGAQNPGNTPQLGADHNTPESFIANSAGVDGKSVNVSILPTGVMQVTNTRNGEQKSFAKK